MNTFREHPDLSIGTTQQAPCQATIRIVRGRSIRCSPLDRPCRLQRRTARRRLRPMRMASPAAAAALSTCIALGLLVAAHGGNVSQALSSSARDDVLQPLSASAHEANSSQTSGGLDQWESPEAFVQRTLFHVTAAAVFLAVVLIIAPAAASLCMGARVDIRVPVVVSLLAIILFNAYGYVPAVVAPRLERMALDNARATSVLSLAERASRLSDSLPGSFPHEDVVAAYTRAAEASQAANPVGIWAARVAAEALRHLLAVLPEATVSDEDDLCPVCLESMNGTLVRRLHCGGDHALHVPCMDRWAISCPVCKRPPGGT